MKFNKLEIEEEGSWFQRQFRKPHTRKTVRYILIGALAGFLFYYLTEGVHLNTLPRNEVVESIIIGAFLGFFITNSPCARGRC